MAVKSPLAASLSMALEAQSLESAVRQRAREARKSERATGSAASAALRPLAAKERQEGSHNPVTQGTQAGTVNVPVEHGEITAPGKTVASGKAADPVKATQEGTSRDALPSLTGRVFLLLQGPQSKFFPELATTLISCGAKVIKLHFCGGDVLLWGRGVRGVKSLSYHGKAALFPAFIGELYAREGVTDLVLYSDWRPLHQDAILIARDRGIHVWVFEEGYLRAGFVTLERDGVNGRSSLPSTRDTVLKEATDLPPFTPAPECGETIKAKVRYAIWHHVGNTLLWPVFRHYHTHRSMNIFCELMGILPRYLLRKRRKLRSAITLSRFLRNDGRCWFYPLQLSTDSQVQLYSPYIRQEEAITCVLSSFARCADQGDRLLIKDHPLDNGLIPYRTFIDSAARALGIEGRVSFVEDGNLRAILAKVRGVILINSTVGLTALLKGKPVFCLGKAIYAMNGLAATGKSEALDRFWSEGRGPERQVLSAFLKVLRSRALVEGSFYAPAALTRVAYGAVRRFAAVKGQSACEARQGNSAGSNPVKEVSA